MLKRRVRCIRRSVHDAEMIKHLPLIDSSGGLGYQLRPPHIAIPFRCAVDCEFQPQRIIKCLVFV